MEKVLKRFLEYIKVDTQSDPKSRNCPSTDKQFNLAKLLEKELNDLKLESVSLDENGYVTGVMPANSNKPMPTIGFISHMDTSSDFCGKDVNAQIIENYQGEAIFLNKEKNIILSPTDFPELNDYIGQTLITTDGTTLLGADDKAGIAEILTALEYLNEHPEIEHGTIKVGFTPDEEIGRGADKFDVKTFDADFAYTIDGGQIGELEYENFNAAYAKILVQGRNVHPGYAKDKMINSIIIASEFNDTLPVNERPEYTEGYEGFYHIVGFDGSVEKTEIEYIIRDHNQEKFEYKKQFIQQIADFMNKKYGENTIVVEMKDQYYNMREKLEKEMHIIKLAEKAMLQAGVEPLIKPIRGGTDGSKLSFMGLPCPNIFTGGHNFHGKFEFVPLESMQKAVEVIVNICTITAGDE